MLLPNNQVYYIDLNELKSFYHAYQHYLVLMPKGHLTTPTTFQEDLVIVINYFNGLLTDYGVIEYCARTPYEDGNADEREMLLYKLYEELEAKVRRYIPNYHYRDDVVVTYEQPWVYILDRRKQVYVPDTIPHTAHQSSQRRGEPTFDDVEWV